MHIKVNDFFCGAGGVGLGFMQAGCEVIWACDFDKYAVETYKHNVGQHVVQADIKKLTSKDIPHADIWAFGFPCQDLSIAGKKKGFNFQCENCRTEWNLDAVIAEAKQGEEICCPHCGSGKYKASSRSGMFFEMMRLLDETKQETPEYMPDALFIENVKGLKTYIPVLEVELKKRGYTANIQMYNSKYWGVPQNRERYYIVGLKEDIDAFIFPKEQHNYVPKLSTILEDDVDEKYFIPDEKAQKIIQQALQKLESLGEVHAALTPDRLIKRQNGRRAKENEEEMFTLTAQDIHGVIIQTPRGNNSGNIYEVAPTLTANAYQENNFVCESIEKTVDNICNESGLLNPDDCGKTLRVRGGGSMSKKHNYQHIIVPKKSEELNE